MGDELTLIEAGRWGREGTSMHDCRTDLVIADAGRGSCNEAGEPEEAEGEKLHGGHVFEGLMCGV